MQTREHIQLYYFDKEERAKTTPKCVLRFAGSGTRFSSEDAVQSKACKMADVAQGMTGACSHLVADGPTVTFHRWMAGKLLAGAAAG